MTQTKRDNAVLQFEGWRVELTTPSHTTCSLLRGLKKKKKKKKNVSVLNNWWQLQ
jgi:hypothetical protein